MDTGSNWTRLKDALGNQITETSYGMQMLRGHGSDADGQDSVFVQAIDYVDSSLSPITYNLFLNNGGNGSWYFPHQSTLSSAVVTEIRGNDR